MTMTLAIEQPPHPAAQSGRVETPGRLADQDCAVPLKPVVEHADGPEDDEVLLELAERGLRHYTSRIATAVGAGAEAAWCEWADAPSAYIALDQRLPGHADRDVALIWAAERGWAVAAETGCGEDLLITASLGGDVLPAPETVAAWFRAVLADAHRHPAARPSTAASTDVTRELADWAGREPILDSRNGARSGD